jgi:8-oxo-dGTP pyrophosphatase MutT (NUDIX family)
VPEPEAAVAIVLAREPEEAVLLIRRAEREGDSWSGHWSLPGGRCDPDDPDPLHTALRELREECGIVLARQQMQAALPYAVARRRTGRYLLVAPFLFPIDRRPPTILDPAEAVEAFWIPLRNLIDPAMNALRPVPGRPPEILFPAVELNCVPLWGFTYRLLSDWLELTPSPDAGFDAARATLQFVLSLGLPLLQDWVGRTAIVAGPLPVADIIGHFSQSDHFHRAISCLDVRPDRIAITGPQYEEYLIAAGLPAPAPRCSGL